VPPLRLRAIAGAQRGREFIFSGPRVRIGRSRDNDLILPEREAPLSSGHHAEGVLDSSGVWWIVDLSSTNGTLLNDVAVNRHELRSGDQVTFGDDRFVVAVGRRSRAWMRMAAVALAALAVAGIVLVERRAHSSFVEVAAAAARSVFLIVLDENGRRSIVGTGFVVAANGIIATNAHVADALAKRRALSGAAGGVRAFAVQGDSYDARGIVSASIHPDWRQGSLKADVALVQLELGAGLAPLRLADAPTIAALRRGTPLAAFGFPAASTDPARPRGRLSVDVIGDVRGDYIEVGLGVAPGMSGSPVFDDEGAVVGIVAGGDFVGGPDGAAQPSGSSVNWAISVSVVKALLATGR
jgi:S1-C subfamily serine protease